MIGEDITRHRNTLKDLPTITSRLNAIEYLLKIGTFNQYTVKNVHFIDNSTITREEKIRTPFFDQRGIYYLWGVHFRPSISFRIQMEDHIRQSRISSYFGILSRNETCVAIHMRKADRQIDDLHMKEWCRNHTTKNPPPNPRREDMPLGVSYGRWMDYGCLYRLPYGDASLEHFLNASLSMSPENRNVFIMTDDPPWLDRSVEKVLGLKNISSAHSMNDFEERERKGRGKDRPKHPIYGDLRLFTLASLRNDLKYEANVDFWASIELARQCQGLVIHAGSAVARFITLATCYRSGQSRYMHCPDLLDVSGSEMDLLTGE